MASYVLAADSLTPLGGGDSASTGTGLCQALVAAGHQVTVLTLAAAEIAAATPGLARRLRTVAAKVGDRDVSLPLFEGRLSLCPANMIVLAVPSGSRSEAAALLGTGAATLVADGLLKSDVAIGWGETAALALSALPATCRIFVLPTGHVGAQLGDQEQRDIAPALSVAAAGGPVRSLAGLGALAAGSIVVPSASAARLVGGEPELAERAADEPLIAARFGCDEPPHDPAHDSALAARYDAQSTMGKAECRKALGRQLAVAVGPRTLILTTPPLRQREGAASTLQALAQLTDEDVVVIIPNQGDRAMLEHARILSIEHAGKIVVASQADASTERQILAGADAIILSDQGDRTGRAASLALRYGTLPLAPDTGANGDFLIDYDVASATGTGLLFVGEGSFDVLAVIRRAMNLRADTQSWPAVVKSLLLGAPCWSGTVATLDSLRDGAGSAG